MQSLKALFKRRSAKPIARVTRLRLSEDGFVATKRDEEDEAAKWSEIERISTYKVDCFAYDMIWLVFERQGLGVVGIPEDAEGFDNLISGVNESIPGINPEWYPDVMHPAFATNFAILYQKKAEG
jgi:hypothetical protein